MRMKKEKIWGQEKEIKGEYFVKRGNGDDNHVPQL